MITTKTSDAKIGDKIKMVAVGGGANKAYHNTIGIITQIKNGGFWVKILETNLKDAPDEVNFYPGSDSWGYEIIVYDWDE